MGINKKQFVEVDSFFDDEFNEVTAPLDTELTGRNDPFDADFEVTYEEDPILAETELNMDAYKDVLSVLNELDETGSMDYLEANRTRTINLDESFEYGTSKPKEEKEDHHAKHKGLSDYFGDIFKKHD